MIKIQKQDKENIHLSFSTDMSISLANAIRRSILEIPVLAIDEVEIIKNDSALFDEIIAHRLGLVPIKTEKVTNKELKFGLKGKGPGTVYSSDLTPSVGVEYKLPLTILNEGQEIELNATAKFGIGLDHIKYSPGLMFYKHDLDEEILNLVSVDLEGNISFDETELKEKGFENKIPELKKLTKINDILIGIESWGQMNVQDIFTKAIETLDKNLTELNKAVK